MLYEAIVTEVLPKVAGVRVRFRDLVPSGFGLNDYVRVLCPSMSTHGGASLWLPEEGEHGVVGELRGGTCIWLGSTPFLDQNQVDPTPGIAYMRHRSGVTTQIRDNGDFEIAHPSGLRITASVSGGALPELQRSSKPIPRGGEVPVLGIIHPSGTSLEIAAEGDLSAIVVGNATVQASGDVSAAAGGSASLTAATTVNLTAPRINLLGEVALNGTVIQDEGIPGPPGPTGPTGPTGPAGSITGDTGPGGHA